MTYRIKVLKLKTRIKMSQQIYRGKKIRIFPLENKRWKYQILFFNSGESKDKTKMFMPKVDFSTDKEALAKAKESIDNKLK
jgi:hypothetical protein